MRLITAAAYFQVRPSIPLDWSEKKTSRWDSIRKTPNIRWSLRSVGIVDEENAVELSGLLTQTEVRKANKDKSASYLFSN
jgi:hypothetical protein